MAKKESIVLFFEWKGLRDGFFEALQEEDSNSFQRLSPEKGILTVAGCKVDVCFDAEAIRKNLSEGHWQEACQKINDPLPVRLTYDSHERKLLQKAVTPYLSDILIDEGGKDLVWTYSYRQNALAYQGH
jgi:hypothetical protein